jgi:hypothetical protein
VKCPEKRVSFIAFEYERCISASNYFRFHGLTMCEPVMVDEVKMHRSFEKLWRRIMRYFKPTGPDLLPETLEDFKALMEVAFYQGFECGERCERELQKGTYTEIASDRAT